VTEPEAWREIARHILEGKWGGYLARASRWMRRPTRSIYTTVFALYSAGVITSATAKAMELRVSSHLRLSVVPRDSTPDSRALAALWLALEAEEEGA
jgi:hypothetical protein